MTHAEKAEQYVADVIAGRVLACKWVRLACRRHHADRARESDPAWPYRFDAEQGSRICRFAELLPHVKGEWALPDEKTRKPQRIRLEPWQCFILCSLFLVRYLDTPVYAMAIAVLIGGLLAGFIGWLLGVISLRLRDDIASEPNNREANQRTAPAVENGLFLVPKVIE